MRNYYTNRDPKLQPLVEKTRLGLQVKEIKNLRIRCEAVEKEVNEGVRSVIVSVNMGWCELDRRFSVQVDENKYMQHIAEWQGLSRPYKSRQIPSSSEQYGKNAKNWANGCRARVLAAKVFPNLIGEAVKYCGEVSFQLFRSDSGKATLFFELCKTTVILHILNSNVRLDRRAAETPLICQNSINKYGLSNVLKNYLPGWMDITKIAISLLSKKDQELYSMTMMRTDLKMKVEKNIHKKIQANESNAIQRAFADLQIRLLGEYRSKYMENPRVEQTVLWNDLSQEVSQRSDEDLRVLLVQVEQLRQRIYGEFQRRSQASFQDVPNFATMCNEPIPMNVHSDNTNGYSNLSTTRESSNDMLTGPSFGDSLDEPMTGDNWDEPMMADTYPSLEQIENLEISNINGENSNEENLRQSSESETDSVTPDGKINIDHYQGNGKTSNKRRRL